MSTSGNPYLAHYFDCFLSVCVCTMCASYPSYSYLIVWYEASSVMLRHHPFRYHHTHHTLSLSHHRKWPQIKRNWLKSTRIGSEFYQKWLEINQNGLQTIRIDLKSTRKDLKSTRKHLLNQPELTWSEQNWPEITRIDRNPSESIWNLPETAWN